MNHQLRQIYDDLSNGRLSQQEALEKIRALKRTQDPTGGTLLLAPVWEPGQSGPDGDADYAEHHVVLCELTGADALPSFLPGAHFLALHDEAGKDLAERYAEHALACFERIRSILQARPQGRSLVQIVLPDDGERRVFAGLCGLVKAAALENPQLVGQIVLVPADTAAQELAARLSAEKPRAQDTLVHYAGGVRHVLRWQEVPHDAEPPLAFRNDGVYLITGGLGALGTLFAREILANTDAARVILTGREKERTLDRFSSYGARVSYRAVDLGDGGDVQRLVDGIRNEHGRLDGILHCAGMIADNFILKKSHAEFRAVLNPKVAGTAHLDRATAGMELDFVVLFSSVAGAMGNVGQADYAAANGFLDAFAAWRNAEVAAGRRRGRTRSIDWSLWQAGGMGLEPASRELLEQNTGIRPMRTATGIDAFHRSLALPHAQLLVAEGDLAQMRRAFVAGRPMPPEPSSALVAARRAAAAQPSAPRLDAATLAAKTEEFLRRECSDLLKVAFHKIDPQAALEQYGIDSILAMKLTNQLEKTFGTLSKTLFFEYQTIGELTKYFVQSHAERLHTLFGAAAEEPRVPQVVAAPPQMPAAAPARRMTSRRARRERVAAEAAPPPGGHDGIAIIGLSGRYPEAVDVEAYWQNLRDGKDCIIEVPKERWDWRRYFSEDRTRGGHHYSKWGGFIEGVDEFDPLFFNISPKEARGIDPQERLFLQHAWMAMEDAGYTRAGLRTPAENDLPGQVGVYAGVMYTEYQLFGAESTVRGKRLAIQNSMASIANRVSYVLNVHGPSVTLDTMCSSSLTAIHYACQDLKLGRTNLAIAGGVNVSIHPNKYLMLSAGQFISSDGHCQSFGEGGDGYIPGEGVGVVVLKRLADAERDGDHIYGVIRGSALNHGGKTNGYTVPNPQAQAAVIGRALAEARVDARHISYVEAHGTGTKLGDPIEIAALARVFGQYTQERQFCLVGSAKSNIGHCESAAGVAGLTKVVLQLQHGEIVPSLHSEKLNPHIDFASTPFVVNQSLRPWERPVIDGRTLPRIAAISSFGAGGSNAHLIVEEYTGPVRQRVALPTVAIVLSARTAEQLQQKGRDLLRFVRERRDGIDLASMAYTLQVGREAMDERAGFVVSSVAQLADKLEAFVAGREVEDVFTGQVKRHREAVALFSTDADLQRTVDGWFAGRKLEKLLDLWVKGLDIDWSRLYTETTPQRMSLPTYPFARERYWIDVATETPEAATSVRAAVLHPLLHVNDSDLRQQAYRSTFDGDEYFLRDHHVDGRRTMPAAAYLEMARAAVEHAARPAAGAVVDMRDVVWAQPVTVGDKAAAEVRIALLANDRGIDYEIYSVHGDEEIVHCQGRASIGDRTAATTVDLEALMARIHQERVDPESVYASSARIGRVHGSALKAIAAIRRGADELLVQLHLPAGVEEAGDYVLHPTLIESALQAALALSGAPAIAAGIESLCILGPCAAEMVAWVRRSPNATTIDLDLCDTRGNLAVQMRGIRLRPAAVAAEDGAADVDADADADVEADIEIRRAPVVRKEIVFVTPPVQSTRVPIERKKPSVSLSAPGSRVAATSEVPAARPPISLRDAALPPLGGTAVPAGASVRLYDDGHGIFSVELNAESGTRAADVIPHILHALDRVQQEPSLKGLRLRGLENVLARGGWEDHNAAIEQKLYRALVAFPYPVIAIVQGNTAGAAFLATSLCDFMVCNEDAHYAYTDPRTLLPTPAETALLSERFGAARTEDFLYRAWSASGAQLRAEGWTCPVVPPAQTEETAERIAGALSVKSRDALRLLKQHLTRALVPLVDALKPVAAPAADEPSPDDVLVLTAEEASAPGGWQRGGSHKAVVLTGDLAGAADLQRLILESDVPVVAALTGNARGEAWLNAQMCDACVHDRDAVYSAEGVVQTEVFARRFGIDAANEIVMTSGEYRGSELAQRAATIIVAERDRVLAAATEIAAQWAKLPRATLAEWKHWAATTVRAALRSVQVASGDAAAAVLTAPSRIPLQSRVVTATAHPGGIVVVKMEDREAKNMFSDALTAGLAEAFEHIGRSTEYKVVVLTGYDTYFASGGTKETLLAIQQGKAKFTDLRPFQAALDCTLPVIAAMQGHGIGAGWTLGMFADLVLLSDESRYVSPYMGYGFTPGAGATLVLPEKLGHDIARESLLTAQPLAGRELRERNVRLTVVPRADLDEVAMRLARKVAGAPRNRLIAMKAQATARLRDALEETYRLELAMHDQTFVGRSETLARIEQQFHAEAAAPAQAVRSETPAPARPDHDALARVTAALRTLLANELQMRESDIDENAQFVDLGLDSVGGVSWVRKINEKYKTAIEATKVYSYPTLAQLSRYVKSEAEERGTLPTARVETSAPPPPPVTTSAPPPPAPAMTVRPAAATPRLTSWRNRSASRFATATNARSAQPVAIIGMAGQFPQARNVDEFWRNIAQGKNCITEIPRERWDVDAYYQPGDPFTGKTYSRWAGTLDEYDRFDPLFFNISPTEAESMDPQQRLFLQACWHSIEHAGYDARAFSGTKCGVFAGCANSDYHQLSRAHQLTAQGFTGSAMSILAARISYFLNLQGPCLSIDTACSSSLVAVAQACESLLSGDSDVALAGGVYVMAGPEMHIKTSQAGMLSPEGRCFTFDERADGFVPGEVVGVVLLKRLADAERDGDVIYGVIEGWGVNQDGKTNGITAPNPDSQTRLEQEVYDKFRIDPAGIQLIEAHGTGTKLGDPIEVEGLRNAFRKYTRDTGYCALGSVKSNIGHSLTAAGIAGVIKLVMALQHRQLPPTINFERLNEHIDLKDTPFYVNTRLQPWEAKGAQRRRAAVSSFGFSGTNAHVVIGEYVPAVEVRRSVAATPPAVIVPVSARTPVQLDQRVADLLAFVRNAERPVELVDIAYTLQVGRTPMDERLGFVVSSVAELTEKLEAYVRGEKQIADFHRGAANRGNTALAILGKDNELQRTIVDKWFAEKKLANLLELWVHGLELDWNRFYANATPRRIALPLYPFAKERYWIDSADVQESRALAAAVLHPMLHSNVSDLHEQRYRTTLTGDEFFLTDHQVTANGPAGQKVLPAVAYLEMARAAVEQATPDRQEGTVLELHNTVWAQPIVVSEPREVEVALAANEDGDVDYEIYSRNDGDEVVHCQGRAIWSRQPAPPRLDLEQLAAVTAESRLDTDAVYAAWSRMGLAYGPTFRAVTEIRRGSGQLLARVRLPEVAAATWEQFVLHPSMTDGALQACVGLMDDGQPRLPFALESLRIVWPCTPDMAVWVRYSAGSQASDHVVKLDVDLCDDRGNVCVQMRGLSTRPLTREVGITAAQTTAGRLFATPVWQSEDGDAVASADADFAEHHVVVCDLPTVDAEALQAALPRSRCLSVNGQGTIAERYADAAVAAFERIRSIVQARTQGEVLVQIVAAGDAEHALFAGLSALLKTASMENPRIAGQLVLVPAQTSADALAALLRAEKARGASAVVRHDGNGRRVLRWREAESGPDTPPPAFKDGAVYLITGGLGALGLLFAREILARTGDARIVLTGRSALTAEKQAIVERLCTAPGRVVYRQLDLGDRLSVEQLIDSIDAEHGRLDGILHCAGMLADNYILKKESAEFRSVLAPKVTGTLHLDRATRELALDFFVLFSSVASAIGNLGQADYATANGFLDHFAAYRNGLVAAGQRHGRTRSINWSLWQDGGMRIDSASRDVLQRTTGLRPLPTESAMEAFHRALSMPFDQILVGEGDVAQMRQAFLAAAAAQPPHAKPAAAVADVDAASLAEKTQNYLRRQFSGLLKLPADTIDPQAPLEKYGIDSILAMKLTNELEKTFGSLSKTLFFEYQTIRDLAGYFIAQHGDRVTAVLDPAATRVTETALVPAQTAVPAPLVKSSPSRRAARLRSVAATAAMKNEPIAIIGLSGRYPEAANVEAYWDNLREGKDCIVEVPRDRWDWREYFTEDRTQPGHHYSKWGGFITGVDEFDPLFFNIPPREAKYIDPQERLFLQHAWMAIEDAGYTRATLQIPSDRDLAGQVGVYVGVMYTEYQLFGAEATVRGKRMGITGSPASIANRVSYALNLHGPSMTIDTMCSSSLTAIHIACQDLKQGRTSLAIAGGVNVTIHPNKYLVLSAGQFISSDGHCQSFGVGGDGYIPGEGVGAVVLKRLSEAERDGDHIYGIIRGSALNHGGKTNGYSVPNPQAQASAISRALAEARIDARHVSYIEAHGTGTKLGDPIEITALQKAFQQYTQETGYCLIGSAKSNIGHCEAAAGIAGLTKVLLQMQHQQIVPSLHSAELNPHIDFPSTPFVVNQTLRPWEPPVVDGRRLPRIAGISSFGAGGSNAHTIVEEYPQPVSQPVASAIVAVLLSARTPEQLQQKVRELLTFVRGRRDTLDLVDLAYTLQVGREAMDERAGFIVSSIEELVNKLQAYVAGEQEIENAYRGQVRRHKEALSLFSVDADLQRTIDQWIAAGKLPRLVDLWVKGVDVDWGKLHGDARPRRISLPVYPFARERYWIDAVAETTAVTLARTASPFLHPLLHSDTSDPDEQRYASAFTGEEFFLADHRLGSREVLPAGAYVEMARAAIEHAFPAWRKTAGGAALELRDIAWAHPALVAGQKNVQVALSANDGAIDYEIYSAGGDEEIVHCHGQAVLSAAPAPARIDLDRLRMQMTQGGLEPAGVYAAAARIGLTHGAALQGISGIERGNDQLLARLRLPRPLEQTAGHYVLHPAIVESALQACRALAGDSRLPLAADTLRILSPCTNDMIAWARSARGGDEDVVRIDVDLCDDKGNVCAELRGVQWQRASVEAASEPAQREIALAAPAPPAAPAAVERKKPAGISLAAPGAVVAAAAPRAKTPITLSNAAPAAAPQSPSVRLYDDGNGVFSIRVSGAGAEFVQALEKAQHEPALKVLVLSGIEHGFARGRDAHHAAIAQKLYRAIAAFPMPIVAAVQGDAVGAAFLAAALCDFMVCSEDASYGFTDPQHDLYPGAAEGDLFGERFGAALAHDLLYVAQRATGSELRARGWTCPIVAAAEVEARARKLAAAVADKPAGALRLLKQHLMRRLAAGVDALTPVEWPADASAPDVLVVRWDEAEDLAAAFAEVQSTNRYKAIVLAADGHEGREDGGAEVQRLVLEAPVPVVAALAGGARGAAWVTAQFCDACVYDRDGVYSAADVPQSAAALFTHRLGEVGREIVLTGAEYRGSDLRARAATVVAAPGDQLLDSARRVAEAWAAFPRTALAEWKRNSAAMLRARTRDLAPAATQADEAPVAGPIPLQSRVVSATAYADGIVEVTLEDREAKNMFSDAIIAGVTEVFAHIAESRAYKVVVLTGYDTYFASGGTKESLLAIQQGQVRFTDAKIFQLPLDCRVPVIAAMQGHGIGAGWTLGMFADLVLLSEESRYVSPYMGYGFTPGAGATWILPERLGHDLGRDTLLTAQPVTGRDLKERGLRLPILPRAEVRSAAMALARKMAALPRHVLTGLKQQLIAGVHEALEETYRRELAMHDETFVGRSETLAQIETSFEASAAIAAPPKSEVVAPAPDGDVLASVTATLKTLLATELQMREDDIDEKAQFVDLGLDSISGVTWIRKINERYGTSVEATKVYSYPTLAQLSRYVKEEAEKQGTLPVATAPPAVQPVPAPAPAAIVPAQPMTLKAPAQKLASRRRRRSVPKTVPAVAAAAPRLEPIAVIGMAGQFPQARNLEEFWQNIAQGRNCISEVPTERWDVESYYVPGDPVPGKTNSHWLGALDDYALFDPLFFNISPSEAVSMDPQQRLFLQACWHAIEDAGYDARVFSGSKCGVFAGCATGDYHQLSRKHQLSAHGFTGTATSILAARISYFLNLQGPCVSIDTACSSSLVALAQACDSLNAGDSDAALAGGVYVMAGPEMHIRTSQAGMLSPEGKCFTFDERADGFVPGEGVGVVLLKRLSDAQRDGDLIYGVIHGWGINQDGRTNGITAPNPESQTRLEQEVYDRYGIDPSHIQLVEAHGTATKLGDPIEVEGLKTAFRKYTNGTDYCALGSVKSNIGHTLTAAGIAGAIKVLLALEHRQLPPTIHFERLNDHIDLKDSPFYINTRLQEWERGSAPYRQAATSSFGFSGTNAHVVIGEYVSPVEESRPASVLPPNSRMIVPLSARTTERLEQKVRDLLGFLRREPSVDLAELAYTLQVGREPMEERVGFVVSSTQQLTEKLQAYLSGKQNIDDVQRGQVKRSKGTLGVIVQDDDLKQTVVGKWIAEKKLGKLLELWVNGLDLDWNALYGEARPRRIRVPLYPFAKERYWIETADTDAATAAAAAILHPLLHSNTSDLAEQRYSSTFRGDEFFLADHHVTANDHAEETVLPRLSYLEMARAAIEQALPERPEGAVLELHDVAWAQPAPVNAATPVHIALLASGKDEIDYEIYTHDGDQDVVHCQGRAVISRDPAPARLDLEELAAQMMYGESTPASVYAACARMGLFYGPSLQSITAVRHGHGQVLADLHLPASVEETAGDYVLHPAMTEGALQACAALIDGPAARLAQPRLAVTLHAVRILAPCTPDMFVWVRYATATETAEDVIKLDIDLCDAQGNVCVRMQGLTSGLWSAEVRAVVPPAQEIGTLTLTPFWQTRDIEPAAAKTGHAEHHVVLCEVGDAEVASSLLPRAQFLSLRNDGEKTIAERYSDYAVACFERIQKILAARPLAPVLMQIVVPDDPERALFAGMSGMLKTAAQENPRFAGQIVIVPESATAAEVVARLEAEKSRALDTLVRYTDGHRQVLRWQLVAHEAQQARFAFDDRGVYLITGGAGALGALFAREILEKTRGARVVLVGRSELTPEKQSRLGRLGTHEGRVTYRRVDLGDAENVNELIAGIRSDFGRLDGVLHCAGTAADDYILNKSSARFAEVLAPKVNGTYNLDQATADLQLDFFVLFSSIAGALGNPGQADYAAANGFLDQFAAYRNGLVAAGRRHGRTRAINWPLWQAGGMNIDPATQEMLRQTTGVHPMPTTTGMRAFHRALALPCDQMLVVEGATAKLTAHLERVRILDSEPGAVAAAAYPNAALITLEQLQQQLRATLAGVLRIEEAMIELDRPFVELGLDSFLGAELIVAVNKKYRTELSNMKLFDYPTIRELALLLEEEIRKLPAATLVAPAAQHVTSPIPAVPLPTLTRRLRAARTAAPAAAAADERIAIIGMSGRYPQADHLKQYWENLARGLNAIVEVPRTRWDVDRFYDPDRTKKDKTVSKWLGAMDDIDCFDPLFFRISPQEAEFMDPQHRLFLQESYRAFEDAGYSSTTLSNQKCGVYLGISTNEYITLLSRNGVLSAPVTSNSYAIAAARIAYHLNLKGPAVSVDTACSSSLVAVHLACKALVSGEVDMALAGGVSVWLTPESYVAMSQAGMFSADGQCKTFDDGADGIVNGEGVGAVVLKRLADAERDNDFIYAVILGSGINQDGKTNGITAPSVSSQIELERSVYAKHNIHPESITYVEAHGTGTKLGDPIELEALATVFQEKTDRKNFCAVGSVKSNIGHTTSAAGVAGLHKVLLSLRNRTLVPTLNVKKENSRFDFRNSPFYVSRETKPWQVEAGTRRRAAVSSFGFSGTNAHMVLEEYVPAAAPAVPFGDIEPVIVPLSARTAEQLRQKARDLLEYLRTAEQPIDLAALAHTLQVGREPMEERLGCVVTSAEQLAARLTAYLNGERNVEGMQQGRVESTSHGMTVIGRDDDMQEAIERWISRRKLVKLLELWIRGLEIDWQKLYGEVKPRRIPLPTYPFARERYWIDDMTYYQPLDGHLTIRGNMKSIEDIIGHVADDTMSTPQAVKALKLLI